MSVLFKNLSFVGGGKINSPANFILEGKSLQPAPSEIDLDKFEIIDCKGFLASKGWIDLRCGLGEPGQEYRESIDSLASSLTESGFVKAVIMPNTEPVLQSKNEVDFVLNKSKKFPVEFEVMGAVTKNTLGDDLTEILDMHFQSGVRIFGDGIKTLSNSDRYMKILQYLQKFDGVLFDHAYDPLLAIFGQMHEGEISTKLGMKGIPSLSEYVAIQRNLEIIRYTGGKAHFQTISTAQGVDLIRKAKAEGLNVTADISIYQLIFKDSDLVDFDPNYKVKPPFRGGSDRSALIAGLKDGTIDAIVSNHQPQDYDSKFAEFDLASFGMAGLQTFLPAMAILSKELGWELLIEKITDGPTMIVGRTPESFTIWNPEEGWRFDEKSNKSLSSNNPWFGQELNGKVKFVVYEGNLIRIDE
ncbi:dihydroorotase [Algoriphagus mannitolivorans]|uniref:dihydroorotase n=1 Tax=Algoriphagus mannitolivorans TaxID=226504 RepID=UPI0003FEC4D4|nr:dihydroorotase [Algoriphagus mannitolivorans]